MTDFTIKQNDTSARLQVTLKDSANAVVDVTGATVRFHMRRLGETTVKVDAAAEIVNGSGGVVRYNWAAGDTDTVGEFEAEFEVTFSDARVETFPNSKNLQVEIVAEIA